MQLVILLKTMVAAGISEILVQVSYAIGVAEPTSVFIDTYGKSQLGISDGEIAEVIASIFDLRPAAIEKRLKLRTPIYSETAAYGHMGRNSEVKEVSFVSPSGEVKTQTVETFTWEKLDYVDALKKAFEL